MRRRDGQDKRAAIIASGATRFRTIIMTTTAMIVGMLPLALALEPGSLSRESLGATVIGGLSSSLILTLFIVSIMYLWLAPEKRAYLRVGQRFDAQRGDEFAHLAR